MLRRTAIGVVVAMLVALPATAQDLEKRVATNERGDYAAALWEWKSLAAKGNAKALYYLGLMDQSGIGVS